MFGMIVITIGAGGIIASTIFEIHTKKKFYEIMMKVFPLVFAVGVLIWKING